MSDFKPMLAVDCGEVAALKYPLVCSPKLDGIRACAVHGKALTRSLKPIPNDHIRDLLSAPALQGLDGELMVPGGTFQETTSRVMKRDRVGPFEWHVFDYVVAAEDARQMALHVTVDIERAAVVDAVQAFTVRYRRVVDRVAELERVFPWLKLVPHTIVQNEAELLRYEADALAHGYEGVMLRSLDGPYKFGRSTLKEGYLLKLKRFTDAEALIVGFEERQHNGNEAYTNEVGRTKRSSAQGGKTGLGDLGAFVLETEHGVRFTCGSGLDDALRKSFWNKRDELLGKRVKYRYQAYGVKTAPRSPVFVGLRDWRDM